MDGGMDTSGMWSSHGYLRTITTMTVVINTISMTIPDMASANCVVFSNSKPSLLLGKASGYHREGAGFESHLKLVHMYYSYLGPKQNLRTMILHIKLFYICKDWLGCLAATDLEE